jgi:hypothetical protein
MSKARAIGTLVLGIFLWLVASAFVSLFGNMKFEETMLLLFFGGVAWTLAMGALRQYRTIKAVKNLGTSDPVSLSGIRGPTTGTISGTAQPASGLADDVRAPFTSDPVAASTFHVTKITEGGDGGTNTSKIGGKYAPPSVISVPGDNVLCWTGESGLPDRTRSADPGIVKTFANFLLPVLPDAMVLPAGSSTTKRVMPDDEPPTRIRSLPDDPGGTSHHYSDDAQFRYKQTTIPAGKQVTVAGEVTRVADADLPEEVAEFCTHNDVEYVVSKGSSPLLVITDRDAGSLVRDEERQLIPFFLSFALLIGVSAWGLWAGHKAAFGAPLFGIFIVYLIFRQSDRLATPEQSEFRL